MEKNLPEPVTGQDRYMVEAIKLLRSIDAKLTAPAPAKQPKPKPAPKKG